MGKTQRTKGAAGEREVCSMIFDALGITVKRNLEQTREGGTDIRLPPFNVEVKRRARIGQIYEWIEQSRASCKEGERPIVVCRADRKEWLAVIPVTELFTLIREEVVRNGTEKSI